MGKMTYPNGDEYTGEWKDNTMDGEGTYVYKVGGFRGLSRPSYLLYLW